MCSTVQDLTLVPVSPCCWISGPHWSLASVSEEDDLFSIILKQALVTTRDCGIWWQHPYGFFLAAEGRLCSVWCWSAQVFTECHGPGCKLETDVFSAVEDEQVGGKRRRNDERLRTFYYCWKEKLYNGTTCTAVPSSNYCNTWVKFDLAVGMCVSRSPGDDQFPPRAWGQQLGKNDILNLLLLLNEGSSTVLRYQKLIAKTWLF